MNQVNGPIKDVHMMIKGNVFVGRDGICKTGGEPATLRVISTNPHSMDYGIVVARDITFTRPQKPFYQVWNDNHSWNEVIFVSVAGGSVVARFSIPVLLYPGDSLTIEAAENGP